MATGYPLVEARGIPQELGRQHGEQCRDRIFAFLDYLQNTLKISRPVLRERALCFLPLFERHCPHLVEEIKGLAEGSGLPVAEALAVQIRGELGQIRQGGCTTFVISGKGAATGEILIGQNSDVEPEHDPFAYVLKLQPLGKPAVLMWTFGGQIGYHGLNSAGVAHFANSLGGGPPWKFALPHYPVKRMMLEETSLSGVLDLLKKTPVCSHGNYVLCDGSGRIADIELTNEGFSVTEDQGAGFLAHANHFLFGVHACQANHEASLPDSFVRQGRMEDLIASKFGSITVDDMQTFLADHQGQPTSICRHPNEGPDHPSVSRHGRTVASMIAEPATGKFHVARGNPCSVGYQSYQL